MKALTICQPYAHLIAIGEKRVENRTWPTSYRGPLLIHAGKSWNWMDDGDDEKYGLTSGDFGVIVAVADLTECWHGDDITTGHIPASYRWLATHEHVNGPWCFVLENVRRFSTKFPYRGAQGFFDVPAEVVAEQIASLPNL